MLFLRKTATFQSEKYPQISFTLRVLNHIQRARRDANVAEELAQYREKIRRSARLYNEVIAGVDESGRAAALEANSNADEIARLNDEANRIYLSVIVPNALRACYVSIDGIGLVDGQELTVEALLDSAPEDLLEEMVNRCEATSGLTEDQQKNSESPTTSAA